MKEILISVCALLGCIAVLLASVGLVRFPDFFSRAHAATKASAFGLAVILIGICVSFPSWNVVAKATFAIVALFLTLPVASQALADAARDRVDSEE
jgi:multicomponent Na+:H+ antiporter subunit G